MKKLLVLLSSIMMLNNLNAQVGIGTENPTSTLDIKGSLQIAFKEITTDTTLGADDYYVTYNGTSDATITLPPISTGINNFNGRIYRLKNVTSKKVTVRPSGNNTIRATSTPLTSFVIEPGNYVEIVNNKNTGSTSATWDLSFLGITYSPNVDLYGTTLKIPHFSANISNHNSTKYDSGSGTDTWWIISSTSTKYSISGSEYVKPSKMTIVYEYQGTPFDLTDLHPMFTIGNSSNYPDVFIASFGGFNNVNGKTRLTLTISRIDFIGKDASNISDWQGESFFINALFTRKIR
jgi:hypothetical protein